MSDVIENIILPTSEEKKQNGWKTKKYGRRCTFLILVYNYFCIASPKEKNWSKSLEEKAEYLLFSYFKCVINVKIM